MHSLVSARVLALTSRGFCKNSTTLLLAILNSPTSSGPAYSVRKGLLPLLPARRHNGVAGHQHRAASRKTVGSAMPSMPCSSPGQAHSGHHSTSGALSVAVIGAGAAGLVAARELVREGLNVTVFEQGSAVGGVWVYTQEVEADVLGRDAGRQRVHSSMYAGLRTNLPREIMAFTDFPFDVAADGRRFPGHEEVRLYLQAFADAFQLKSLIQFNTRVIKAQPVAVESCSAVNGTANGSSILAPAWPRWQVSTKPASAQSVDASAAVQSREFDAVLVCNGHFTEPRVPTLPGCQEFPGLQMHSHNYREAGPFTGKRVAVIGASASGEDISREIAEVAETVYLFARDPAFASATEPIGTRCNIWRRPMFQELTPHGGLLLPNGSELERIDVVIYATGYLYDFPFLRNIDAVAVADNRVAPLYQHVFPPTLAPSLAFVGLPWKVVPFPQYELQAKWIARTLSGRVQLPAAKDMQAHAEAFYRKLEETGIPRRYTHRMDGDLQWHYDDWLAEACGPDVPRLPSWREQMYLATGKNKKGCPDSYRDVWTDAELAEEARRAAERLREANGQLVGVAA